MGFFDSKAINEEEFDLSQRTNNSLVDGSGTSNVSSVGGIRIAGGGKKSNQTVRLNVKQTDHGAIAAAGNFAQAGIDVAKAGFSVVSDALNEASSSRQDAIGVSMAAIDFADRRSASEGLDLAKTQLGNNTMMVAVIAAAGVIGLWVMNK